MSKKIKVGLIVCGASFLLPILLFTVFLEFLRKMNEVVVDFNSVFIELLVFFCPPYLPRLFGHGGIPSLPELAIIGSLNALYYAVLVFAYFKWMEENNMGWKAALILWMLFWTFVSFNLL